MKLGAAAGLALAVVVGCGPSTKKTHKIVHAPKSGTAKAKKDPAELAELTKMRLRCNRGEAAACLEWGEALQAVKDPQSVHAFELACSIGDPADCVVVAEKCKTSSRVACATRIWAEKACVRDHDLCTRAADAVRASAEGQESEVAEFQRKFASGLVAFDCVVSGEPYETCSEQAGEGAAALSGGVFDWLEASCEWKRTRCYRYALIAASIDFGESTTKKLAKAALHVHKTECRYGDPVSCVQEGFAFLRGDERSVDRDMAEVLFAEACNAGEAWGCTALGDMYRKDVGSQEKRLRCTSLYEDACEGGDPEGCWKLGKLYLSGTIVAQDTKRATGLFRRACELGNQAGCDFFGDN